MLLGGSVAVAARQISNSYGIPVLNDVSFVIIIGSALLVSGAVLWSSVKALRAGQTSAAHA
jgi:hypothetical protein